MINTYHSSMAPPPVPLRLHSSHQGTQPVLIPTTMLPQGHSKTLMRFMVAVVLFNLLLSILGFMYLYVNGTPRKQDTSATFGEAVGYTQKLHSHYVEKRESHRVFARMDFQRPTATHRSQSGHLKWDLKFSRYSHPYINYYNSSWLTIEEPGDYFVYSRLTFSKGSHVIPLMNRVHLRKSKMDEPKSIMHAFCHTSTPNPCTATAEEVIKLEKGNQLSVWTEDISLVSYDEKASTFGLYKL
ncbi:CD40 ligand [Periophthalmus magnuspinnatus]|uniref:CD40 ligand n=1 Tax=Periophthalmus magnuspinnatus TaxID=409849 RepID=UPI00145A1C2B|nr:CD40 ligand [Periophthalmus magnuspinnatus]